MVLIAAAMCACGPRGATTKAQPLAKPWPATLPSGMAAYYNEADELASHGDISDAILAVVGQAARISHRAEPIADKRLFAACHALASIAPLKGSLPASAIEFAMHTHGLIDSGAKVFLLWGSLKDAKNFAESLRPALNRILVGEAIARVGVGAVQRFQDGPFEVASVVVVLLPSHVRTSPIARSIPAGGNLKFDFELEEGARDPLVYVTGPDGETSTVEAQAAVADWFRVQTSCGRQTGKMHVQLRATTATGTPETLALFPVWCGRAPPDKLTIADSPNDVPNDPREGEQQLFELLNLERKKGGRPPLVWDERIVQIAREHAAKLRSAGTAPESQHLDDNVRRVFGEEVRVFHNTAHAYGIEETHRGFMDQPMTRLISLSREATHVGIGLVWGDEVSIGVREIFVSEIVVSMPQH